MKKSTLLAMGILCLILGAYVGYFFPWYIPDPTIGFLDSNETYFDDDSVDRYLSDSYSYTTFTLKEFGDLRNESVLTGQSFLIYSQLNEYTIDTLDSELIFAEKELGCGHIDKYNYSYCIIEELLFDGISSQITITEFKKREDWLNSTLT